MAVEEAKKADDIELLSGKLGKFSMRGLPLLSQGASTVRLIECNNLWLTSKVYSGGGENALHSHSGDDHGFFILQGSARFFDADGNTIEAGPLEGVVIPRHTGYRFQSISDENLIMLRVAGSDVDFESRTNKKNVRTGMDGKPLPGKDPRNGTPSLEIIETGEFFGL